MGVRSLHGLEPQCVTPRMKVDLSTVRAWLERVWIENSLPARGTGAARTRAPLGLFFGITVSRLPADMQPDPRLEMGADGAQSL